MQIEAVAEDNEPPLRQRFAVKAVKARVGPQKLLSTKVIKNTAESICLIADVSIFALNQSFGKRKNNCTGAPIPQMLAENGLVDLTELGDLYLEICNFSPAVLYLTSTSGSKHR